MKIGYLFINFLIKGTNFHFSSSVSLRKMCPHSQLFWSAFSHIRTEYKEIRTISPYSCHTLEAIFHQPFYQETDFLKDYQRHTDVLTKYRKNYNELHQTLKNCFYLQNYHDQISTSYL